MENDLYIDNYECDSCDFKDKCIERFHEHRLSAHGIHRNDCGFQTNDNQELKDNELTHIRMKFECDLCDFKERCVKKFYRHRLSVHGIARYHCDKCSFQTNRNCRLEEHVSMHKRYECDLCDFKSSRTFEFHQHRKSAHGIARFHCEKCSYETDRRSSFTKHRDRCLNKINFKEVNILECDLCDYKDVGILKFYRHRWDVHKIGRYHCDKCNYTCTHINRLHIHVASIHEGIKFQCKYCTSQLGCKAHLREHESRCKKNPDFELRCNDCGSGFPNRMLLNAHIRASHNNGQETFHCNLCSYIALKKSTLQRHIQYKHKDPFKCPQCEVTFSRNFDLRLHISSVHKKGEIFHCNICGKVYWNKSSLRQHIATHKTSLPCSEWDNIKQRAKRKVHVVTQTNAKRKNSCDENSVFEKDNVLFQTYIKEKPEVIEDKNSVIERDDVNQTFIKEEPTCCMNGAIDESVVIEKDNVVCQTYIKVEPIYETIEDRNNVIEEDNVVCQTNIKGEPNAEAIEDVDATWNTPECFLLTTHSQILTTLCRLCGSSAEDEFLVSEKVAEILVLTGINTSRDSPYIHPQKLCEICSEKLRLGEAFSVSLEFKPHSENCIICMQY